MLEEMTEMCCFVIPMSLLCTVCAINQREES